MKQLFTLLICSIVGGLLAQSADWNPDANGDGLVGSSDLLALLTAYGESFAPPLEDDAWVECTEEHYTLISDTIFPSDFEPLCDTDNLQGGCYYYDQWLDLQADTAIASTQLSFWEYQDSLFSVGDYSSGRLTHAVTWQNTCNSVNVQTLRQQLNVSPDSSQFYSESVYLVPPYYDEGSRLRFLQSDWQSIPKFLRDIGLDFVNEKSFFCDECDAQILTTLIPNSYGFIRLYGGSEEPGVLYETIGVIRDGSWIWR